MLRHAEDLFSGNRKFPAVRTAAADERELISDLVWPSCPATLRSVQTLDSSSGSELQQCLVNSIAALTLES